MEIRNWNEIIGKNGIRIEIEFFFKMEITLYDMHANLLKIKNSEYLTKVSFSTQKLPKFLKLANSMWLSKLIHAKSVIINQT